MLDVLAISIFCGFAAISLIGAVGEVVDSIRDRQRGQTGNGWPNTPIAIIAAANVRRAVASVVILLLLIANAVSYLWAPVGTINYAMGLGLRVVALFCILAIVAFLIVAQRIDRQQLNDIARRRGGEL